MPPLYWALWAALSVINLTVWLGAWRCAVNARRLLAEAHDCLSVAADPAQDWRQDWPNGGPR